MGNLFLEDRRPAAHPDCVTLRHDAKEYTYFANGINSKG